MDARLNRANVAAGGPHGFRPRGLFENNPRTRRLWFLELKRIEIPSAQRRFRCFQEKVRFVWVGPRRRSPVTVQNGTVRVVLGDVLGRLLGAVKMKKRRGQPSSQ